MTRLFKISVLALVASLLAVAPRLGAQAALTQTTLSAAVAGSPTPDLSINVTSATGFANNQVIVIDGEAMFERGAPVGTTINVTRGQYSTAVTPHANGAQVYTGSPLYFSSVDPTGPCTATNELALPRFVLAGTSTRPPTISLYDCTGPSATTQRWQIYERGGFAVSDFAPTGVAGFVTYTASGAITPQPGTVFINGTTLAMTLVAPTLVQNGMVLTIVSTNASAHTLTPTGGFGGVGTVGTWTALQGNNIVLVAVAGKWWVVSTRGVTVA